MKDLESEYDIFESGLNIQAPWHISYRTLTEKEKTLHIYIRYGRGSRFSCPNCGHHHCPVHDILDQDRTWRHLDFHLDFWPYMTILHAKMPRVNCPSCRKIRTINIDWERPGAGLSHAFKYHVMSLMAEMPVYAAARLVEEHDTRVWRVFHYYVEEAMEQIELTNVRHVAVDETSSRRGHQYVTLFMDSDTKRLLFATRGKGADVLKTFRHFLINKGISPSQIKEMCMDMYPSFIAGLERHFPDTAVTFDKFHVMKIVNEGVDKVRRQEQSEQPALKKTRYLWLKNQRNLSHEQEEKMTKLKDMDLATGRAYRLKLSLQEFWTMPGAVADLYLHEWRQWAMCSRLQPMIDVGKTLKNHEYGILRWFRTRMTNGLIEGVNSLIQATKRKARGYRSTGNLIAIMYATVNK
ncbi:ISL3 family transposase [Salibacterium halotolerans]|uniref:Transposase n=1 Tax=Salibacterium halotolerans TaxID=1884432 RepID=A0A1I5PKK0_9BACI|nr:ISL3 family transposase [Salibacterium halotolerans]SFP34320.1 Transposase [Salibacterium halotolerans]